MFSPYNPSIHKYVPAAVDSLAKLLARDDPNRAYYKAIFAADCASTPPYDLLTRAFGLSICPIPEHMRGNIIATSEVRKPFLMQGLLAAEILSSLADNGLARSWLESTDGFAVNLLRLVCLLSTDHVPQPAQRHPHAVRGAEADFHAYGAITGRGLAVLRRLVEKSRVVDDSNNVNIPLGVMPKKENLLGALLTQHIDPHVVRQLCAFAGLVD
jgi:SWI/SNF chromatin-remodeling complex subunit SWI1